MAGIDYYSCDVCKGKAFYDADIYSRWEHVGEIKAICKKCSETHEIVVREKTVD